MGVSRPDYGTLPTVNFHQHHRLNWAKFNGVKYQSSDYVIVGWQEDDLPRFGYIQKVYITCGVVVFKTKSVTTLGVDRHYHSLMIDNRNTTVDINFLSELKDSRTYHSHLLSNGGLYITLRSHVEKIESEDDDD